MTWTSKPRIDAQAVARAMCEGAQRRRLAAEALPDAPYFQEEAAWHDGRIKLGRHSELWLDWTDEDWWHMLALAAAGFLVAFVGTVFVLIVR